MTIKMEAQIKSEDQHKDIIVMANKGFHLTFKNGWTVSIQLGCCNYCDNYSSISFGTGKFCDRKSSRFRLP